MMSRKKFSIYLSIALIGSIATNKSFAQELTLAHSFPEGSIYSNWANELADCIKENSGVTVEVFGGGQLGYANSIAKGLEQGTIDIGITHVAAYKDIWPELSSLSTPGLVKNPDEAQQLAASEQFINGWDELGGIERNLSVLSMGWKFSTFVAANSLEAEKITDAEDLSGLKIRTQVGTSDFFEALGAEAYQIPSSVVHYEFARGEIDGAIVDTAAAEGLGKAWEQGVMVGTDKFLPFNSPFAAVMSKESAYSWGWGGNSRIRERCFQTSARFQEASKLELEAAYESFASSFKVTDFGMQNAWDNKLEEYSLDQQSEGIAILKKNIEEIVR